MFRIYPRLSRLPCRAIYLPLILLAFSWPFESAQAWGCGANPVVPGKFLVTQEIEGRSLLKAQAQSLGALKQLKSSQLKVLAHFQKPSQQLVTYVAQLSKEELAELSADPALTVEPDCFVQTQGDRDPQWNHTLQSSAFQWPDTSPPANPLLLAVVDTGVDVSHEDLQDQLWVNSLESNGRPGVDDDNNGCIDDLHGCDFSPAFGGVDGDPRPGDHLGAEHGTHVAGLALAAKNGRGSEGLATFARLMAVKAFPDHSSDGKLSDLLSGVYYAARQGAKVINCSWGLARPPGRAEWEAFQYAISQGALPIVAAGNAGIDARGFSPAALSNVLTVGSINSLGERSAFSNFSTSLPGSPRLVYAPGGDSRSRGGSIDEYLVSTLPRNTYGGLRGTSMATPLISGLAAWIAATRPDLTPLDWREIIYASVDSRQVVQPRLALELAQAWRSGFQAPAEVPSLPAADELASVSTSSPGVGSCALKSHSKLMPYESESSLGSVIWLLLPLATALLRRRRRM